LSKSSDFGFWILDFGLPEHQTTHTVDRFQIIAIVLFATLCVSIGETLLSAGMKSVGKGDHAGLQFVAAAVSNASVLVGTLMMMAYFGLYAFALSKADISFVLPITAMSYLFVATLAKYFLHEPVSPARWIGAGVITLGVVIVARAG
jgi:drug/metabolite transporter (DMT)-like permease